MFVNITHSLDHTWVMKLSSIMNKWYTYQAYNNISVWTYTVYMIKHGEAVESE